MFQKGNKFGGAKKCLTKPELLLPLVFGSSQINWAKDFCHLYRTLRKRQLTIVEQGHFRVLLELLPYLCTKVQLKEISDKMPRSPGESAANAKQTSDLLRALEGEHGPSSPI